MGATPTDLGSRVDDRYPLPVLGEFHGRAFAGRTTTDDNGVVTGSLHLPSQSHDERSNQTVYRRQPRRWRTKLRSATHDHHDLVLTSFVFLAGCDARRVAGEEYLLLYSVSLYALADQILRDRSGAMLRQHLIIIGVAGRFRISGNADLLPLRALV